MPKLEEQDILDEPNILLWKQDAKALICNKYNTHCNDTIDAFIEYYSLLQTEQVVCCFRSMLNL